MLRVPAGKTMAHGTAVGIALPEIGPAIYAVEDGIK